MAGGRRTVSPPIREVLAATAGPAAWALLRERLAPIDGELWRARQEICIVMVARAAAERAWRLDRGDRGGVLGEERFVGNLVEMVIAAMGAPEPGPGTAKGGPGRLENHGS